MVGKEKERKFIEKSVIYCWSMMMMMDGSLCTCILYVLIQPWSSPTSFCKEWHVSNLRFKFLIWVDFKLKQKKTFRAKKTLLFMWILSRLGVLTCQLKRGSQFPNSALPNLRLPSGQRLRPRGISEDSFILETIKWSWNNLFLRLLLLVSTVHVENLHCAGGRGQHLRMSRLFIPSLALLAFRMRPSRTQP